VSQGKNLEHQILSLEWHDFLQSVATQSIILPSNSALVSSFSQPLYDAYSIVAANRRPERRWRVRGIHWVMRFVPQD
jgi:hypothetical protein